MPEITNPQKILDNHPFTAELRKAGLSTEDLAELSFGYNQNGFPFSFWTTKTRSLPLLDCRFVKPYCALKWVLLGNPPWSRDRDDAWHFIGSAAASFPIEANVRSNKRQSARARKPRVKMPDDGRSMAEVVRDLVRWHPDLTAKELWPHLQSELDKRELNPEEHVSHRNSQGMVISYDLGAKRRTIGLRRFANLVSAARRNENSR